MSPCLSMLRRSSRPHTKTQELPTLQQRLVARQFFTVCILYLYCIPLHTTHDLGTTWELHSKLDTVLYITPYKYDIESCIYNIYILSHILHTVLYVCTPLCDYPTFCIFVYIYTVYKYIFVYLCPPYIVHAILYVYCYYMYMYIYIYGTIYTYYRHPTCSQHTIILSPALPRHRGRD